MNTQQKILDKALEMFNERGIEYVGLRELASVLAIRVSNITYYFPTKDDLVYALSQELSKSNAKVLVEHTSLTMEGFLDMLYQAFQNHVRFRCLLLSVVHLMSQNKHLAATYQHTQTVRNATIKANLQALTKDGFLKVVDEPELDFLVYTISLISRFWISEAAISFRALSPAQQIQHSLTMITALLTPYTTEKGTQQAEQFMKKLSE